MRFCNIASLPWRTGLYARFIGKSVVVGKVLEPPLVLEHV